MDFYSLGAFNYVVCCCFNAPVDCDELGVLLCELRQRETQVGMLRIDAGRSVRDCDRCIMVSYISAGKASSTIVRNARDLWLLCF